MCSPSSALPEQEEQAPSTNSSSNTEENDIAKDEANEMKRKEQDDAVEVEDESKDHVEPTGDFRFLLGTDEPHVSRRKEILKKYPEIMKLYGPDVRLFYWCIGLITLQLGLSAFVTNTMGWSFSSPMYWLLAWSIGGTFTHSMALALHELSHNLAFKERWKNEWLMMLVNCGQGIPSGMAFKRYHYEHHRYQGDDKLDCDIPSLMEVKVFGTSSPMKVLWLFLQPLFYALRPLTVNPKPISQGEMINFLVVAVFDISFSTYFGMNAVVFNIASSLLGMGLHPIAGHFISEHYTFTSGQETYSYYGPLNAICFNVGYHNEHHDFPKVSGFNLPKVKAIAAEFYDERWTSHDGKPLQHYTSWTKVLIDYIMDPTMGPHRRIKRHQKTV